MNCLNLLLPCSTDARAQKRYQGSFFAIVRFLKKLMFFCRKMFKRLEDLAHDSAGVKAHLMLQMKELNNYVAELVNFGISVS
jgi:hypothetical protein